MNARIDLLVADSLIGVNYPPIAQTLRPEATFNVSADDLRARIRAWERVFAAGNAAATVKAVRSDWQRFFAWCERSGVRAVPVTTEDLLCFLNDQVTIGRRYSTITRYVFSIREVHRGAQAPDPTVHDAWRDHWKALKVRLRDATRLVARQTEPMVAEDVTAVLRAMGTSPRDQRDAAILRLASDTLCRESELAQVELHDFKRTRDRSGWTLDLGRTKNDPDGIGSSRFVTNETKASIDAWCKTAGIKQGPVFLPIGGRPKRQAVAHQNHPTTTAPPPPNLTPEQIARILRRHAQRAGIDNAARITGHSARVGSAIDLIEHGHSVTAAAFAGGWKSERMVLQYAKRARAGVNAMADLRLQQAKETAEENV